MIVFKNVEVYILIFFTYSFLGWLMESIKCIFKEGKFINRGFLIGPYCPVYGTGILLISLLLQKYENDIPALFIMSTLICGALEYFTSFMMEKLFNARWWDYTNRRFNINGRICLETLLPFGIAGTIIIKIINPIIIGIYEVMPNILMHIIISIITIIFIIDFIISFMIILNFRKETFLSRDNKDNRDSIGNRDNTEEISKMVYKTAEDIIENVGDGINDISDKVDDKLNDISEKVDEKIQEKKWQIEQRQRIARQNIEKKIKDIKEYSDELTEQVKLHFNEKSALRRRLIEAFPGLKIKQVVFGDTLKKQLDAKNDAKKR